MEAWAAWRLADGARITLILDETPQHNHLRAMKLAIQVRGRAVPVLWRCYKPRALPDSQDRMVLQMLAQAARLMAGYAHVELLADRGLAWAAVMDFCAEHGWYCILRPQGHTRVRLSEGEELRIDELTPRPGTEWRGRAEAFKNAGWRSCTVMASWRTGHNEPWLLITNLPPKRSCFRQYCKRTRIEESFRDEKSHGFRWQDSRVRTPEYASRLLLVMAIAMSVAIRIGLRLIKTGRRHEVEPRHKRRNSVFLLGVCKLHSLAYALHPPS